ncbi:hypothetical protein MHU86_4547 [Fragilaria crotonensis]|nr:hypothetical protein MHU86_4547 [Fragilaria crotonensis]
MASSFAIPRVARSTISCGLANESVEGSAPPPPVAPPVKCPNCDKCDGSGRILGGIGVLIPAWPIKAYRPCPNFIERGGQYIRSGQSLDEIAFGGEKSPGGK